jgi:hypothetical protein
VFHEKCILSAETLEGKFLQEEDIGKIPLVSFL